MMKTLFTLATLVLAGFTPAQDPAIRASLTSQFNVVAASSQIELTLRVEVLLQTDVDATVLRGMFLKTTIDGESANSIGKKIGGKERLAAGLILERRLSVDLSLPPDTGATRKVQVNWPGLPGATAEFLVAPDPAGIDWTSLDLAQTRVVLQTSQGQLSLGFFPEKAPEHVRNFIGLAKDGFYDGTKFHRIWRNFMIQGGCPNTREGAIGSPGSGIRADQKRLEAEFNDIPHERGILSMARHGTDPDSASCQFFIVHANSPHLNGKYSAFGRLVAGFETLDAIAAVPVRANQSGEHSVPLAPVHLFRAIVLPVTIAK